MEELIKTISLERPTSFSDEQWAAVCEEIWDVLMKSDPKTVSIEIFGEIENVDTVES